MKKHGTKKIVKITALLACLGTTLLLGPGITQAQGPDQMEKMAISQQAPTESEWKVLSTSPGVEVVSQSLQEPGQVLTAEASPLEEAEEWLMNKGFEEGRNLYKNKLLYFAVGSAIINASPNDPSFIDSRYMAFQRAELDAKAKMAISLGVDLTTSRGSSDREINPAERAELEKIVNTSPTLKKNLLDNDIAQDVYGLFKKATHLANAKMDQLISETGGDAAAANEAVKEERRQRQAAKARQQRLRNISETSVKAAASAFADVQGMQIYQTFEGSTEGDYQVVVITLWSQNLQRLVDSMSSGQAPSNLPPKKAKAEITKQLPSDPSQLACLSGVRAYINQHGEHVLLGFGQAGVEVIGGRKGKAYELAGKKAKLRAMAAMRNFMGEKIAFTNSEELREALALYADEAAGGPGTSDYKSLSQFEEMIKAEAGKQQITGIHGLQTFKLTHPFTDKPMVLKVMAWPLNPRPWPLR